MKAAHDLASVSPPASVTRARPVVRALLLHGVLHPLLAIAAFGAYEHFKLNGQSVPSYASLVAAAGFALAPVRAMARELLAVEGAVLHLVHGVGGLAVIGLAAGGVISGGPILDRAAPALGPFAIMGAAQALMHQDHPRSREEADALRRFAASLPELQQLTRGGSLGSPASARRAVAVLSDLIAKAQALGEAELRADPGFQGALRQTTARVGLSLGLDGVDRAIARLAADPATAGAAPELRRKLAAARRAVEQEEPAAPADGAAPRRAARRP
jgi:hypothetical protein